MSEKPNRSVGVSRGEVIPIAAVLFVLLLAGICGQAAGQTEGLTLPIRFAVIGDRTGGHEPGIHGEIMAEIERMKPDFVVGVGDMIEGYSGDIGAIEEEWKEYAALARAFSMPFYMVPGNHDIWDSTSTDIYREHIGEPYYSFDAGPIHFVTLDTGRWSTVTSFPQEQVEGQRFDRLFGEDQDPAALPIVGADMKGMGLAPEGGAIGIDQIEIQGVVVITSAADGLGPAPGLSQDRFRPGLI